MLRNKIGPVFNATNGSFFLKNPHFSAGRTRFSKKNKKTTKYGQIFNTKKGKNWTNCACGEDDERRTFNILNAPFRDFEFALNILHFFKHISYKDKAHNTHFRHVFNIKTWNQGNIEIVNVRNHELCEAVGLIKVLSFGPPSTPCGQMTVWTLQSLVVCHHTLPQFYSLSSHTEDTISFSLRGNVVSGLWFGCKGGVLAIPNSFAATGKIGQSCS